MNTIIQIPPSSKKDQTDAIKNQEYFPLLSFDITKHMWDLTTQRTAFKIVLVVTAIFAPLIDLAFDILKTTANTSIAVIKGVNIIKLKIFPPKIKKIKTEKKISSQEEKTDTSFNTIDTKETDSEKTQTCFHKLTTPIVLLGIGIFLSYYSWKKEHFIYTNQSFEKISF